MSNNVPEKIFTVLMESEIPLGRKEICNIASIQPQLFDYWITSLIKEEVVIIDDRKRYTVQKILKDKELPSLIIPLIKKLSENLQTKDESNLEECVSANLSLYMKYLAEDTL